MCVCVCVCVLVAQSCLTCNPMDSRLFCLWNYPGKKTRVSSHSLLHGIFKSRNLTWVSCIAGRSFTVWATREVHTIYIYIKLLRVQGMQNLNQWHHYFISQLTNCIFNKLQTCLYTCTHTHTTQNSETSPWRIPIKRYLDIWFIKQRPHTIISNINNNKQQLTLSAHYIPGTVLSILCILAHLILKTLWHCGI